MMNLVKLLSIKQAKAVWFIADTVPSKTTPNLSDFYLSLQFMILLLILIGLFRVVLWKMKDQKQETLRKKILAGVVVGFFMIIFFQMLK